MADTAEPREGVRVDHVTIAYPNGKVALRDASLTLPVQTICGLVGVNGGGKSTLFKALMGTVPMLRGSVTVRGLSSRQAQKRNMIAYVPQSEDIDWTFPVSVLDVAMMGRYGYMGIRRRASREDRAIVQEALARVNMAGLQHRQIGELSGGQRKRAFLARALAQRGSVMLLDEPMAGVDTTTQSTIIQLLRELREAGHTIVISTHDLASIPSFCDQVALINGTVVAAGPTAEVFTASNLARTFGGPTSFLLDLASAESASAPALVGGA